MKRMHGNGAKDNVWESRKNDIFAEDWARKKVFYRNNSFNPPPHKIFIACEKTNKKRKKKFAAQVLARTQIIFFTSSPK